MIRNKQKKLNKKLYNRKWTMTMKRLKIMRQKIKST